MQRSYCIRLISIQYIQHRLREVLCILHVGSFQTTMSSRLACLFALKAYHVHVHIITEISANTYTQKRCHKQNNHPSQMLQLVPNHIQQRKQCQTEAFPSQAIYVLVIIRTTNHLSNQILTRNHLSRLEWSRKSTWYPTWYPKYLHNDSE